MKRRLISLLLLVALVAGLLPCGASAAKLNITKQPVDVTAAVGGSATFTVGVSNYGGITWHMVSPDGTTDILVRDIATQFPGSKVTGKNSKKLTIVNVQAEMNGWKVYCAFSGKAEERTNTATLWVEGMEHPVEAAATATDLASATDIPEGMLTSVSTEDPWPFAIRHGSRDAKRIAITMDDCYDREWVRAAFELCQQYGVRMTFFPLGDQLKEKDADLWRAIAASDCEIGSHTNHHNWLGHLKNWTVIVHILKFQENLDRILGYHYQVNCMRPPYGNYETKAGNKTNCIRLIKLCGYQHVILWDVSQTDPKKAIKDVKNGSILLYHARKKDYNCLVELIPKLIEQGYELVTVSELLGFGPIQTSDELYVYDHTLYY